MNDQHFMFIESQFWPELEDFRHACADVFREKLELHTAIRKFFLDVIVAPIAKKYIESIFAELQKTTDSRANWRHIKRQHAAQARGAIKGRAR